MTYNTIKFSPWNPIGTLAGNFLTTNWDPAWEPFQLKNHLVHMHQVAVSLLYFAVKRSGLVPV